MIKINDESELLDIFKYKTIMKFSLNIRILPYYISTPFLVNWIEFVIIYGIIMKGII